MIALLRAEATRMLSRKISWIAFGIALLAIAGVVVVLGFQTRPPSAAEVAQGQQAYERDRQEWADNHAAREKQCTEAGNTAEECAEPEPRADLYTRHATTFAEASPIITEVGVAFLGLAALIVSASMIGADFGSGTIANWLTFIPGRLRVYAAKLIIVVVGCAVATAVVLAVVVAALAIMVSAQQGGHELTGLRTAIGTAARGVALTAFGSVVGGTVAFLTRRTIAALGIAMGYLIARVLVQVFSGFSWYGTIQPWLPDNNALALLNLRYQYQSYKQVITPDGISLEPVLHTIHWPHGLIYLGVGAVVLVVASAVVFRRRDVT